ncbi:MAG TPA: 4-deoxy-4-formamido-L-arabinose-phosphoundecaprenol deformylase [Phycisphaerae bacterium]|nr:4-deoxy-4-formamido-L-arabinose-phosphoundecaprenol deformylase [Phycisphaerae bacterium]
MNVGLRIDVDTFRGTRLGVPNLLRLLDRHSIRASFFFSVGPDNMGRHLWRLLRPHFFHKMLRTKAPGLYGWDILLRGTLWPGPVIGKRLADVIRSTADAGHEVGLHAWDHHRWQMHLETMDAGEIRQSLDRGVELLSGILGRRPTCSAVPGWRCQDRVLVEKESFGFQYNSDCRGESIFRPVVAGRVLSTPQVPVSLPTYDEVLGRDGIDNRNYNEHLASLLAPDKLNTLTIHAEVEGISCLGVFDDFVRLVRGRRGEFVPFGDLLGPAATILTGSLVPRTIPGREGWVSCQSP